ncbi:MAG: hypothetical protein MZV49_25075 [Rhodopseudomonas palustris]|nr:hypothetical protein [Rhodopseudomonas palustris]
MPSICTCRSRCRGGCGCWTAPPRLVMDFREVDFAPAGRQVPARPATV